MFEPGDRVGVAVSGGADSVFLLHALFELAPRWDLKLSVLHLDHGLRGEESRGDARFVRELAVRFGLSAQISECDVARVAAETGDNLEQTARRARHGFFKEALAANVVDRIATGHTRSDQAETVLFRFLRGSGTAGLAGVRPVTSEGLARPLIELDRDEIREYLTGQGIAWREDSSNATADFVRNRIRRDLLPALVREWNPALSGILAHTAEWAQDEEAYWDAEIDRLAAGLLTARPPVVLLRCDQLCALPRAAARRLARRAVEIVKGDLRGIAFQHIERILQMAAAPDGHDRAQAPGLDAYRSFEWIRLAPPGIATLANRNFRMPVSAPGRFTLPDNSSTVELEVVESGHYGGAGGLDWTRIDGSLELRNWRPGDQYRPIGRANEERIKTLFQEARIPLWERRNWPILENNNQIVWARRFGPATDFAATADSRAVLRVREDRC
jgi:tRNA(Ile)-lysidine synthase